jgi:hypothetical protein
MPKIVAELDVPGLQLGKTTVNKVVEWAKAIEAGLEKEYYIDSLELDLGTSTLGVKLTIKNKMGLSSGHPDT